MATKQWSQDKCSREDEKKKTNQLDFSFSESQWIFETQMLNYNVVCICGVERYRDISKKIGRNGFRNSSIHLIRS